MICPNCGFDNLPGAEECSSCLQDLTQLDRPIPLDRIERNLMETPVAALRPPRPVTVPPTTTLAEVMRLMLERDLGAILVAGGDGKLLGIFSERDLLIKVAGLHEAYAELAVSQFMTSKPETISAEDTLAFAIHKMDIGGYRHLPLVKDGRPTGVISVRDMVRYITRLCRDG
jgi:CBS domain-containing protein